MLQLQQFFASPVAVLAVVAVVVAVSAAVLESLNDVAVSHVHGIDNSLCRISNLTTYMFNGRLDATNNILKCIEIAVKIARKLTNCSSITLNGIHDEVAVLVVLQL